MPLSHVSLATGQSNFKAMRDFYVAILTPLGYRVFLEHENQVVGFGPKNAAPDFWLHCGGTEFTKFDGNVEKRGGKTHVAFLASSRGQIDTWYKAAIKAGGVSNGQPGERPHYTKGYYAAFVIDPLGNNVELVHWSPLWLKALQSAPYVIAGLAGAGLSFAAAQYYG